jgi:hypothetical protein
MAKLRLHSNGEKPDVWKHLISFSRKKDHSAPVRFLISISRQSMPKRRYIGGSFNYRMGMEKQDT